MAKKQLGYRKVMVGLYFEPDELDFVDRLAIANKVESRGDFFRRCIEFLKKNPTALKKVLERRDDAPGR